MLIVITGCRKVLGRKLRSKQRKLIRSQIKKYTKIYPGVEFLIGCAYGVDEVARRYCKRKGIPYRKFKADWDQGMAAGHMRNQEMVYLANFCLAFWDGKSTGTKDCITRAYTKKIPVTVLRLDLLKV